MAISCVYVQYKKCSLAVVLQLTQPVEVTTLSNDDGDGGGGDGDNDGYDDDEDGDGDDDAGDAGGDAGDAGMVMMMLVMMV